MYCNGNRAIGKLTYFSERREENIYPRGVTAHSSAQYENNRAEQSHEAPGGESEVLGDSNR